ncbi:monovalent cation/H+ antiporter complex subunit F [Devosia sp. ZB163]|jgi:multicomponent Na+:H+ antiporter subunit F|uniref:monovalent cation/H+ antiporter complex subunit F n=1 Tax=Devosia sp. ZB163 TaxID=3025938 RepID=UPI00235FFEA0|nr:monovalent cation/H+ antiporter complex subunit F [Devosia sp. ZB163]MDC9823735.1 monovalent cation/H+ antiporter complex subunit F [Devosia sp. ZB163]
MSGAMALQWAGLAALGLLLIAMFVTVIRLVRGPNLGDRILALDMISLLAAAFIAGIAVVTGFSLYIDIAIALALVSFLSTVALARYLLARASRRSRTEEAP